MKRKRSFITNSSSSSFILSTTKKYEGSLKIKLEVEIDLCRLRNKKATTIEEVCKLMDDYGFEKGDEIYEQALIEVNQGKEIHYITAWTDEDPEIQLIANSGLKKYLVNNNEVKVLMGD